MNNFQIIGTIFSVFGTILLAIGSIQQGNKNSVLDEKLKGFISEQQEINSPQIVISKTYGSVEKFNIVLKNSGNRKAYDVLFKFEEDSVPKSIINGGYFGFEDIDPGVERIADLDLLEGVKLTLNLDNDNSEYKGNLLKEYEQFKRGEKAFIVRFHIEYKYNNKLFKTDSYDIVILNNSVVSVGKR